MAWLVVLWSGAGFTHNPAWHYASPLVCGVLLPVLGLALGVVCYFGKGLDKDFKKLAVIVAILSVLLAPPLMPGLAE